MRSLATCLTTFLLREANSWVQTFLPNYSLIYITSDHNTDVAILGTFVLFMLYQLVTAT